MRLKRSKRAPAPSPTMKAKRPLRVSDLQKVLQDCIWQSYRGTRGCVKRRCVRRQNYYVHVPMSGFTVVGLQDSGQQSPVSWPDFCRDYGDNKAESGGPYLVTMPAEGVETEVYAKDCDIIFIQFLLSLKSVFPKEYLVQDEAGMFREDAVKFQA